jgi:hypothetical protein
LDATTRTLRRNLKKAGLSKQAIDAAWPAWWSDAAARSTSARAELRFTLARRLGLSPKSLSGDRVDFVWKDVARFKHLSEEDAQQQAALTSFGAAIGRLLLQGIEGTTTLTGTAAGDLRAAILRSREFVDLRSLLAMCWGVGIPVVHLRVFPLAAKSMHAMVVRARDGCAILLGRDSKYPAPVAFTLAHEIGHIALGHLLTAEAIVDLADPAIATEEDEEELAADEFALEILTGVARPDIRIKGEKFGARQLASVVLSEGPRRRIEPGTLALCMAYRSDKWAVANAALRHIYTDAKPVWLEVNKTADAQLRWERLGRDAYEYLRAIMALQNG